MTNTVDTESIQLIGAKSKTLTDKESKSRAFETQRIEVVCASGDRYTATWSGIPITDLLEEIEAPPTTTHIIVESVDGHQSCVAVPIALTGLLAFYRNGKVLADCTGYNSRFVAPNVDGARLTKAVHKVETVNLPPGTESESYENIVTDDATVD